MNFSRMHDLILARITGMQNDAPIKRRKHPAAFVPVIREYRH
jgi:hypothetical protein